MVKLNYSRALKMSLVGLWDLCPHVGPKPTGKASSVEVFLSTWDGAICSNKLVQKYRSTEIHFTLVPMINLSVLHTEIFSMISVKTTNVDSVMAAYVIIFFNGISFLELIFCIVIKVNFVTDFGVFSLHVEQ